jgi:hypothetical protein
VSGKTVGKNTPKVPATINAKKRNVTKFPKTPKHKLAHGGKKKSQEMDEKLQVPNYHPIAVCTWLGWCKV